MRAWCRALPISQAARFRHRADAQPGDEGSGASAEARRKAAVHTVATPQQLASASASAELVGDPQTSRQTRSTVAASCGPAMRVRGPAVKMQTAVFPTPRKGA